MKCSFKQDPDLLQELAVPSLNQCNPVRLHRSDLHVRTSQQVWFIERHNGNENSKQPVFRNPRTEQGWAVGVWHIARWRNHHHCGTAPIKQESNECNQHQQQPGRAKLRHHCSIPKLVFFYLSLSFLLSSMMSRRRIRRRRRNMKGSLWMKVWKDGEKEKEKQFGADQRKHPRTWHWACQPAKSLKRPLRQHILPRSVNVARLQEFTNECPTWRRNTNSYFKTERKQVSSSSPRKSVQASRLKFIEKLSIILSIHQVILVLVFSFRWWKFLDAFLFENPTNEKFDNISSQNKIQKKAKREQVKSMEKMKRKAKQLPILLQPPITITITIPF